MKAPTGLTMDAQGRMIDGKGNIIHMKQQKELKINEKTQKDSQTKNLERIIKFGKSAAQSNQVSRRKFFDSALEQSHNQSSKREKKRIGGFNFVDQGTYIRRGEVMRKKQVAEQILDIDTSCGKAFQIDIEQDDEEKMPKNNAYGEPRIKLSHLIQKAADIPQIEWWDEFFVPTAESDSEKPAIQKFNQGKIEESDIYMDRLTHFIQHPVPIVSERVKADEQMTIPYMLTAAEKKKLRRKKRLEKEKDKQEKVQLGLAPAPQARVTMSNFMKVMAKEAIQNPSGTEKKVQQLVAARVNEHLAKNEAGKLTRDQKEAKMKRKHERDLSKECRMCVFRVQNVFLVDQLRFKVDMNAQQLHLGGVCLISDQNTSQDLPNIVVVEGGPTAIKKYKKLMTSRIDWKSYATKQQAEAEKQADAKPAECILVWEGNVSSKKVFDKWRVIDIKTQFDAKRVFVEKNQEHLFSMAMSLQTQRIMDQEDIMVSHIEDE